MQARTLMFRGFLASVGVMLNATQAVLCSIRHQTPNTQPRFSEYFRLAGRENAEDRKNGTPEFWEGYRRVGK